MRLIVSGAARVKKWGGGKMTLQFDDATYGKYPSRSVHNRALCAFGLKLASRKEKALMITCFG